MDDLVAQSDHASPIETEDIGVGKLLPDLGFDPREIATHRTRAIEIHRHAMGPDERAHHRTADEAGPITQTRAQTIPTEVSSTSTEAALPLPGRQPGQPHLRRQ